jgi:hypothetical protein
MRFLRWLSRFDPLFLSSRASGQRGRWPAIDYIIQFSPFAMSAQLAQRVVSYPHPIIFGQAKAPASQPHASERERNGVA